MKQFIAFGLGLLMLHSAIAQPTLDSTYDFHPGTSYTLFNIDPATVSEGPAGSMKTWDFSLMERDGITINVNYIDPASTGFLGDFPTADVALDRLNGNTFDFFKSSATGMKKLGTANAGFSLPYTDQENLREYPMSYNDILYDSFSGAYKPLGQNTFRRGNVIVSYDAFGTAFFPLDTFFDVMRIHVQESFTDSAVVLGFPVLTQTDINEYIFIENLQPIPLITVTYTTITTQFGGSTLKTVFSPQEPLMVDLNNPIVKSLLHTFPQPATDFVNISMDEMTNVIRKILVLDLSGKILLRLQSPDEFLSKNQWRINLEGIRPGVYILKVKSKTGESISKIVLH